MKFSTLLRGTGIALLFSLTINTKAKPGKSPDQWKAEAEKAFRESQIKKAIENYENALSAYNEAQNPEGSLKVAFQLLDAKAISPLHQYYEPVFQKIDSLSGLVKDKPLQLKALIYDAKHQLHDHRYSRALTLLQKGLEDYKQLSGEYPDIQLQLYANLVNAHSKVWGSNEAKSFFDKALNLIGEKEISNQLLICELYSNYGIAQFQKSRLDTAQSLFRQGKRLIPNDFTEQHFIKAKYDYALAKIYLRSSRPDSTLKYVNNGSRILENNRMDETPLKGNLYLIKSELYLNRNNFYQSLQFLKKTRSIYQEVLPAYDNRQFKMRLMLARVYKDLNKDEQALKFANKSLKFVENQQTNSKRINFNKARVKQVLSMVYQSRDELNKAENHIQSAVSLYKQILPPNHINLASVYSVHFDIALAKGEVDTAFQILKTIKPIVKKAKAPRAPEIVRFAYSNFSIIMRKKGRIQEALEYNQGGFRLISTNFDPDNLLDNPNMEQIIHPLTAFYNGYEKLRNLYQYYQLKGDPSILTKAFETALLLDSLSYNIRSDFVFRAEHRNQLEYNDKFYPYSMRVFKALLEKAESNSKKRQIAEKAFAFADKDKASLLSSAKAENELIRFSNHSDSLFNAIKKVNEVIDRLEQKMPRVQNTEKRAKMQEERLTLSDKKEALYEKLCEQYPKDCRSLKGLEVASLKQIQAQLAREGKNMVEYIGMKGDWFAVVIQPDQLELVELNVDSSELLKQQILAFRAGLINDNHELKKEIAHELYQKLFEPLEGHFTTDNLVIVPDGILGYLPFSTLLNEKNGDRKNHFLLNDYAMTYSPSASLWKYQRANKTEKHTTTLFSSYSLYTGFAPSFKNIKNPENQIAKRNKQDTLRNALDNIPYADEEVSSVLNYLTGQIYLGQDATEKQFKTSGSKSRIIHLATHGLLNDQNPANNKLVFATDESTSEDGALYTHELYNLDLRNTDLSVLSACNTGYGKLQKGEGVMNLARGFKVAGCPNILMTLWSIDDRSSSELMNLFYQNLKEGKPKAKALQQAKLSYIKANDREVANPYYWAGFVMMGSANNIQLKQNNNPNYSLWLVLGGLAIVSGGGFYLYRKKRRAA